MTQLHTLRCLCGSAITLTVSLLKGARQQFRKSLVDSDVIRKTLTRFRPTIGAFDLPRPLAGIVLALCSCRPRTSNRSAMTFELEGTPRF
jgi:hypothetical protein